MDNLHLSLPKLNSRPSIPHTPISIKSNDSEHTAIHKEVTQLYQSVKIPRETVDDQGDRDIVSTCHRETDITLFNIPLEDHSGGIGDVDPNTVYWSGHDKDNPLNWSWLKKAVNFSIICFMCFVSPFASSVFVPAIPDMMQDFRENDVYLSAFVVSSYVLGYAVGPLIVGPLSEIYGRVWLYHICNLLFVGFTCGCAASHSLRMLAVMRFIAGWGGSSVFTLGPASTADMVRPERRGPFLAVIGVMFNLGPAVSPVIGSYVNAWRNWRWVFILTAVMGAVGTLAGFAGLSETYAPILLERKTRCLRSWTGNHALRSGLEGDLSPWQTFRSAMLRPLKMLLLPNILLASILTATGYGFMYILYCTFPTTFTHVYHWQPKHIGYGYLGTAMGNVLGLGLGAGINGAICKKKAAKGDTKPENHLFLMMFMWPLVGIGLIMYGWTAQNGVHWMAPLVGSALFGAGAMSAVFFCGVYIVDAYTVHSASGMAASTVLRSLFGGVVPLFANKLYGNLGVGWSFTILGCIALLMAPVPYYFYRYGERLRASKTVPL